MNPKSFDRAFRIAYSLATLLFLSIASTGQSIARGEQTTEPSVQQETPQPKEKEPDLKKDLIEKDPTQEKVFPDISIRPFKKPDPPSRSASTSSGWQFGVAPYLFAAGISGTVGARGQSVDIDSNFGNVWENLDIGFMGQFEARKGRFVSLNDLMWVKLSAERDTPGPLFDTAKLGVNLFIFDPEAGYRLIENSKGSVDVLGGARIWSVETNLDVTSGRVPGFSVSQRKTFAAPVVGVRGIANLPHKFNLFGKFDIGGAGIGADLTTQVYGGVGYRIMKCTTLAAGYRWLQVDYDDSSGFIFDTHMNGFLFGAKINF